MIIRVISYDTVTYKDIENFFIAEKYQFDRIHPDDFMAGEYNLDYFYINCVLTNFEQRKKIQKIIQDTNLKQFTYIHPSAVVLTSDVAPGVIVYPYTTVYSSAVLDSAVFIHSNSRISHNTHVRTGTFIGGQVNISGSCDIGEYCVVYPGCNIIDKISVASDTVLGANTLVRKSIKQSGIYSTQHKKLLLLRQK